MYGFVSMNAKQLNILQSNYKTLMRLNYSRETWGGNPVMSSEDPFLFRKCLPVSTPSQYLLCLSSPHRLVIVLDNATMKMIMIVF